MAPEMLSDNGSIKKRSRLGDDAKANDTNIGLSTFSQLCAADVFSVWTDRHKQVCILHVCLFVSLSVCLSVVWRAAGGHGVWPRHYFRLRKERSDGRAPCQIHAGPVAGLDQVQGDLVKEGGGGAVTQDKEWLPAPRARMPCEHHADYSAVLAPRPRQTAIVQPATAHVGRVQTSLWINGYANLSGNEAGHGR